MGRGEARNVPPNNTLMYLSEKLRGARDWTNQATIPFTEMGVGELLFGEGPERLEDSAYGRSATKGSGMAAQLDPRWVDVVGTPVPGGAAVGVGLRALARSLRKGSIRAVEGKTDKSRREAMKKVLAGGAVAAGVAAAPKAALVKALKEGGGEVAAKTAVKGASALKDFMLALPEATKSKFYQFTEDSVGSFDDPAGAVEHTAKMFSEKAGEQAVKLGLSADDTMTVAGRYVDSALGELYGTSTAASKKALEKLRRMKPEEVLKSLADDDGVIKDIHFQDRDALEEIMDEALKEAPDLKSSIAEAVMWTVD